MSKIGNYRVGLQVTDDYRFGWESAERGEPRPEWQANTTAERERFKAQCLGWDDCRNEQVSP